jgi:hypothetical protein
MKKISEILPENSLSIQSTSTSLKISEGGISIYTDKLTKEGIKTNCLRVFAAFSSLDPMFTDLLTESLQRNKFTDARLTDAVNHVIDNFKYPKPSVADFVSYDKKIKVYRYDEMVNNSFDFLRFKKVRLSDEQSKPLWVRLEDFETNNFEEY